MSRIICRDCALDVVKAFAAAIGPIEDAPPQCFLYRDYHDLAQSKDFGVRSFMLDGSPTPLWGVQINQELHSSPEALGFFTVLVVSDKSSGVEGLLVTSYSRKDNEFDAFFTDLEYRINEDMIVEAPDIFTEVDYTKPLDFH